MKNQDQNTYLALFKGKNIRRTIFKKEWWFSILDIVKILTDSPQPKTYWAKMKERDKEMSQPFPFWEQLKMIAEDGKMRGTDCANTEGLFRIIQSIPSPKAEPLKRWLAKVGYERMQEIENPELATKRTELLYKLKGYPEDWIEKRMRGIAVREELTDEWKKRGAETYRDYEILTAEITEATFGLKPYKYKELKGLKRENLRDHMDDFELILTMLGERTTTEIHRTKDSKSIPRLKDDARVGGAIAGTARKQIERKLRKSIVSENNFLKPKKENKIIKKSIIYLSIVFLSIFLNNLSPAAAVELPKLQVSSDGHYVQTESGVPFMWISETLWGMAQELNRTEIEFMLDGLSGIAYPELGITNVVKVSAIFGSAENSGEPQNPVNANGHTAFNFKTGSTIVPDFTSPRSVVGGTPDEPNDYWDHLDFIVRETKERNMYLLLNPQWSNDYVRGIWSTKVLEKDLAFYNKWLANRYKDENHIIWMIGGDGDNGVQTDSEISQYRAHAEALVEGTTECGVNCPKYNEESYLWDEVLIVYHGAGYNMPYFNDEPWLDLDGVYRGRFGIIADTYNKVNPRPVVETEGYGYWISTNEQLSQMRNQHYVHYLSGGKGVEFMGKIWNFSEGWQTELSDPKRKMSNVMRDIMSSVEWYNLYPINEIILSENKYDQFYDDGDADQFNDEYLKKIVAAHSPNEDLALIYFSAFSNKEAYIDLSYIISNSCVRGTWVNTVDGTMQVVGEYHKLERHLFEVPSGWEDGLLKLQGISCTNNLDKLLIPQENLEVIYVTNILNDKVGSNAIDGNIETFWHSNADIGSPHEIIIDLGEVFNVNGFRYLSKIDEYLIGNVKEYEFYVGMTQGDFGLPVSTGIMNSLALEEEIAFNPKFGRYAKLKSFSSYRTGETPKRTTVSEINILANYDGKCRPNWRCNDWVKSACVNNKITYTTTCQDFNSCGSNFGKPEESYQKPCNNLGELEPIDQANFELVSVDSYNPARYGHFAFDGKAVTLWHSDASGFPHEIVVDLGRSYNIGGFRYLSKVNDYLNGLIRNYEFYVSTNRVDWNKVASGVFNDLAVEKEIVFNNFEGRYVKLKGLNEIKGKAFMSVAELNILVPISDDGVCVPNWECVDISDWSTCIDDIQSKLLSCTDTMNCDDLSDKPDEITYRVCSDVIEPVKLSKDNWSLLDFSSQEIVSASQGAVNIFDDNLNTFWHSQWLVNNPDLTMPQWVSIDLGGTYVLSSFSYFQRQDGDRSGKIDDFKFYVSEDGISWNMVKQGAFIDTNNEQKYDFTPTTARYFKIEAISELDLNRRKAVVAEIDVWGFQQEPPANTYNILDFIQLITDWFKTTFSTADLNNDGKINTQDLGVMMSNWE